MIEQLILDIKGVLYNEEDGAKMPTPGSLGFINHLRERHTPFLLGTNVTSEMPADLVDDLNRLGFGLSLDDVASCIDLSVGYLKSEGIAAILLISDNERLRQFYKDNGIEVIGYDESVIAEAVVAALDTRLYSDDDLRELVFAAAAYQIKNNALLVALHRNMTRVDGNGNKQPNVGQLVKELEEETGYTDTVTIGKPSETFYLEAMKRLPSQKPEVTLMVGDDPKGDLEGAYLLGMPTAFVRSPKYPEWPADMAFKPDYDVDNLGEMIGGV